MRAPGTYTSGTRVRYHGSLTHEHGEYVIADICECPECDAADADAAFYRIPRQPRYVLAAAPGAAAYLEHVRPASLTPPEWSSP